MTEPSRGRRTPNLLGTPVALLYVTAACLVMACHGSFVPPDACPAGCCDDSDCFESCRGEASPGCSDARDADECNSIPGCFYDGAWDWCLGTPRECETYETYEACIDAGCEPVGECDLETGCSSS